MKKRLKIIYGILFLSLVITGCSHTNTKKKAEQPDIVPIEKYEKYIDQDGDTTNETKSDEEAVARDPKFKIDVSQDTKKILQKYHIKNETFAKVAQQMNDQNKMCIEKYGSTCGLSHNYFKLDYQYKAYVPFNTGKLVAKNIVDDKAKNSINFKTMYHFDCNKYTNPTEVILQILKSYNLDVSIDDIMNGKIMYNNSYLCTLSENAIKKIYPDLKYDKFEVSTMELDFTKEEGNWNVSSLAVYVVYSLDDKKYQKNEVSNFVIDKNLKEKDCFSSSDCECGKDSKCNNECGENDNADTSNCDTDC